VLEPSSVIREDFDRIALLAGDAWNHNEHYHAFLLRRLPEKMGQALEIGCGKGAFSRLLAARADGVTAVDLSPEMIRQAEERSADFPNIDFQTADILEWNWPPAKYDAIASIAALHHLPLEWIFRRCRSALAPGGVLAVLDLYQVESPADYLASLLALPADAALRFLHDHRFRESRSGREAWSRHEGHEHYLALSGIRKACSEFLPGAAVRRHLLWRYSIVWKKPA
jgi:SAM-dependent methyltransferase